MKITVQPQASSAAGRSGLARRGAKDKEPRGGLRDRERERLAEKEAAVAVAESELENEQAPVPEAEENPTGFPTMDAKQEFIATLMEDEAAAAKVGEAIEALEEMKTAEESSVSEEPTAEEPVEEEPSPASTEPELTDEEKLFAAGVAVTRNFGASGALMNAVNEAVAATKSEELEEPTVEEEPAVSEEPAMSEEELVVNTCAALIDYAKKDRELEEQVKESIASAISGEVPELSLEETVTSELGLGGVLKFMLFIILGFIAGYAGVSSVAAILFNRLVGG